MTENTKKTPYISHLFIIAFVTCLVSFVGCTPKPTVIHLTRPLDPDFQLRRGALVPTAGEFTALYPDQTEYALYVQEYLKQRLAEIQSLSTEPAEDSQPFQVNGNVKLHRVTDSNQAEKVTIHTEVTFNLHDPKSQSDRQSIVSRGRTQEDTPAAIQAVLRHTVDIYVNQMFPQEITIAYPMAFGKSSYDKLGRKAAADGDYEQAFEYFRKAIDEFPDDHAALYNAGLVSEAIQNYPRARNFYQRAVKLAEVPDYKISLFRVQEIIITSDKTSRMSP
jgi:tetratricopeptide (TPR) repeat protein